MGTVRSARSIYHPFRGLHMYSTYMYIHGSYTASHSCNRMYCCRFSRYFREDLSGPDHVAGWEPYDLRDLSTTRYMFPGLHMYSTYVHTRILCSLITAAIGCTAVDYLDISGNYLGISGKICLVQIMLPGGNRTICVSIYHMFPGLDLFSTCIHGICMASHNCSYRVYCWRFSR